MQWRARGRSGPGLSLGLVGARADRLATGAAAAPPQGKRPFRRPYRLTSAPGARRPRSSLMAFVNHAAREIYTKIVYYGPGLCGKTANVQYIYDHTVVDG